MRIYSYLRASTDDQDASRAKTALENFAQSKGHEISAWFTENVSGATLKRPELFRLLEIAQKGDVLLVEQVDRISRLKSDDWTTLKNTILSKDIRIVALDLPTSHQLMKSDTDEFTERMLDAVNGMLLDMLAAVSRKDYEDRRRRQAEGIAKGKKAGRYKGRQKNEALHANIRAHLKDKKSWREIIKLLNCSHSTIAKVSKAMKLEPTKKL
jgi:DNA invertase Pin-like site-specific DNA recombinase